MSLCWLESSLKVVANSVRIGDARFWLEFKGIVQLKETIEPKLKKLLKEYEALFRELTKLPPKRIQDHAIKLIPSAQLLNIQSYSYPYFQKNKIQQIV